MARKILQIEFDPSVIFNKINSMNGNFQPLGDRLVELLLGYHEFKNLIALEGFYEIVVSKIEAGTVAVPQSEEEARAMALMAEAYFLGVETKNERPETT